MKIGFLTLPITGHLNPSIALARTLQRRGHDVCFLGTLDAETPVRAAGLDFIPFCENEYPRGSDLYGPVGKLHGLDALKYACQIILPPFVDATLTQLPQKLARAGFDLLVIDTIYFFAELVPMSMEIPYVHICNVLDIDFSGVTPASLFDWPLENSPAAQLKNRQALQELAGMMFPALGEVAARQAKKLGLQINWDEPGVTRSKLAVIAQYPQAFDFPGVPHAPEFHYAGPFEEEDAREPVAFPWELLTGKPLVYASLGTLFNRSPQVFQTILRSVANFPEIQVVLSVGPTIDIRELGPIPSNTIVVPRAPQLALLREAKLCITHAGLNTALESLAQGVPMVALPAGFDQPGVAARIAYHGVGEFIGVEETLTDVRLSGLIRKVLGDPAYRERALQMRDAVLRSRGLQMAASLTEQAYEASLSLTSR